MSPYLLHNFITRCTTILEPPTSSTGTGTGTGTRVQHKHKYKYSQLRVLLTVVLGVVVSSQWSSRVEDKVRFIVQKRKISITPVFFQHFNYTCDLTI
jgi:hypothetical protein